MIDFIEIEGHKYESAKVLRSRFDIDRKTEWKWIQRGLLPKPRKIGGRNYYIIAEVDAQIVR